jgi:hypothetical protein
MASLAELGILLKAHDQTSAAFQSAKKNVEDVGHTMQKVGAGMSLAITAPFVMFAKSAIDAASSTEESLNKVRVVFGEASKDIEAFASTAAKNLGLSNQKALEAAGTFGNLFTAMGIGRPVAAEMSQTILTMAADLASFNDMDPTEVLEKLRAGLVGEVEPLRTLGVNLNQARIEAEAMALGLMPATVSMDKVMVATNKVDLATASLTKIQKKYGEESLEATKASLDLEHASAALSDALKGQTGTMSASAKAQAALSLITKDTKNAQGDFANTADSLANSQRQAKAQMEDLTAQMGKMLLPLMVEGTKIVKGLIEKFMGLSPEIQKAIFVVVGILAVLGPLLIVFGTLLTILPAIGTAFLLLTGPIGLVILAIILIALIWTTNMEGIQQKTKTAVNFLLDIFDGFKLLLLNLWKGIVLGVAAAINGVIGVINGFIEAYNGVAEKLGLPLIGKIELVTPNLDDINAAINRVAKDRTARIFATVYEQAAAGGGGIRGGGSFASGGIVPGPIGEPRLIVAHGGEEVRTRAQQSGGGITVNLTVQGDVISDGTFEERTRRAVRDAVISGGFRGVFVR